MAVLARLDLPPVWGALACVAIWLWARAVDLAPIPPAIAPAGWLGVAAGLGFILWAVPLFLRRGAPIEPRRTPTVLITDGPYRHTRNPIYRGLVWATAGWAVICGELTGLALAAAYARVLTARFIRPEEAALEAAFGQGFRDWAARVRSRL